MDSLGKWISEITPGGVGIWSVVGLIIVALIRQKPINQRLQDSREGNLLKERALEMRGMRRTIATLQAEQRIDRHALANLEQCLDALLNMIEFAPERAAEAAGKVRQMRADMKTAQSAEKAGLHEVNIRNAAEEDADAIIAASIATPPLSEAELKTGAV
jgi:hypothetical protein